MSDSISFINPYASHPHYAQQSVPYAPQDGQNNGYPAYNPQSQQIRVVPAHHRSDATEITSTTAIASPLFKDKSSKPSCCSDFCEKYVKTRWEALTIIPVRVVESVKNVSNLVVGIFSNIMHICTLTVHNYDLNKTNTKITEGTSGLLATPYLCVMKILNPHAKGFTVSAVRTNFDTNNLEEVQTDIALKDAQDLGFGSQIRDKIQSQAETLSYSENRFVRHVVSRICAASMILSVIARVVDLALGLICAALSLVTLGMIGAVNKRALIGLASGPAIISDVLYTVQCMINPSSQSI